MIIEQLFDAFVLHEVTLTLIIISVIAYLVVSRKERSLKSWVSSQMSLEVESVKDWGGNLGEKLIDSGFQRVTILKEELQNWTVDQMTDARANLTTELNAWSANSLESLRTWLMDNLEQIGTKAVAEPIKELMTSSLMSNLGKASGAVRRDNAVMNDLANDAMPENIKFLRDQLVSRFPSLGKHLKNPGQIMELASRFGIDVNAIVSDIGGKPSNTKGTRW